LEKQDKFAGFLNHLNPKVKLFVKNETRTRLELGHESRTLIDLSLRLSLNHQIM